MRLLEILAVSKKDDVCSIDSTGKCSSDMNVAAFFKAFGNNVIVSLFIAGAILAVIMIIVSAITMMTSAGDSKKVEKAKKGILAAVIGLVICLCAFAIASSITSALE